MLPGASQARLVGVTSAFTGCLHQTHTTDLLTKVIHPFSSAYLVRVTGGWSLSSCLSARGRVTSLSQGSRTQTNICTYGQFRVTS